MSARCGANAIARCAPAGGCWRASTIPWCSWGPRYRLPYADTRDLSADQRDAKIARGEALVFGHSLSDQIAGQIDAGFGIAGFLEHDQPVPRFVMERFLPTFIATLAVKG